MKTTLNINDHLYRAAERKASEEGKTLMRTPCVRFYISPKLTNSSGRLCAETQCPALIQMIEIPYTMPWIQTWHFVSNAACKRSYQKIGT